MDFKLELVGNGVVELTLEEMFIGCVKEVSVLHKNPCNLCLLSENRNALCSVCGVQNFTAPFSRGTDSGVNEIETDEFHLSVTVIQKEHRYYTRHKEHLFVWVQISLPEALCGFQKPLPTLDKNYIVIKPKEGRVVADEEILVIRNKGMPYLNDENKFGNLYVKFYVPLPNTISRELAKKLHELLPRTELSRIPEGLQECEVVDVQLQEYE